MGSNGSSDVKGFINQEIANNQVVIFSKTYCGYCRATKQLFSSLGNVQVAVHELDTMPNGSAIQNELVSMTGQRSVPNVFVNKQHLGGNDDTQAAHRNGNLAKMLAQN
ncbi:Glutaredoxin-2, mitochondrial [Seminavis robusta]|uniref:Glutaredoxin-2, mitochondrial n=1 Tax=Seminavis robusta TaxID=568900 RepID=A0A9N8E550_9STRA|nr:Glutaredoxin-2, mitochondrial [Seminavis robusta]|eukprot:Sro510_g157270.1 Glutaredoxin-2, mitochondrial (108) ;mRNA; f:35655-36119